MATKKNEVKETEAIEYKTITTEFMANYIANNHPEDKKWFKEIAFDDNGKYQHLIAKKAFCEKYMPDLIPTKKDKKKASDIFEEW